MSETVIQRLLTEKDRLTASVRGNRWRFIRSDQETLETQGSLPQLVHTKSLAAKAHREGHITQWKWSPRKSEGGTKL